MSKLWPALVGMFLFSLLVEGLFANLAQCNFVQNSRPNSTDSPNQVGAEGDSSVYITSDGAVSPSDAPIIKSGSIYTLTRNVGCIEIYCNNIIFDGAGNSPSSTTGMYLPHVNNVTIRNVKISTMIGISLYYASNCNLERSDIACDSVGILAYHADFLNVTQCNITGNGDGILSSFSNYVTVYGNNIVSYGKNVVYGGYLLSGKTGIRVSGSNYKICTNNIEKYTIGVCIDGVDKNALPINSEIYLNNFVDNTQQVYFVIGFNVAFENNKGYSVCDPPYTNNWDNCSKGNFWSNYTGADANGDGIGDTAHIVFDENNIDNYPLMSPIDIAEVVDPTTATPAPTPAIQSNQSSEPEKKSENFFQQISTYLPLIVATAIVAVAVSLWRRK